MNKFRARQLDASKPIGIYCEGDNPEIVELNNATNRNVPQLPTGMEKDEESEHHLQQAINHQSVIPVPDVFDSSEGNKNFFDNLYPPDYKISQQIIRIHPFEFDNNPPDYDLDQDDEAWLKGRGIDFVHFEKIMDRLEKASSSSVITLREAKLLIEDDEDVLTSVYDYWLNKRLSLQHSLVSQVKIGVNCSLQLKNEKCIGSAPTDPYVAFRKRTEKMQTRKNRKNDEVSYEKMLKLRRDLARAIKLAHLVLLREEEKCKLAKLNSEIFEKRYKAEDYSGSLMKEIIASRPKLLIPQSAINHRSDQEENSLYRKYNNTKRRKNNEVKERRPYKKKRKIQNLSISNNQNAYSDTFASTYVPLDTQSILIGSEDELASHSEAEEDSIDDPYSFTRKPNVTYLAPKEPQSKTESLSWNSNKTNPWAERSKEYFLTSKSKKCIGFTRRRMGRGGRIWIDRIGLPSNDLVEHLNSEYPEDPSEFPKEWPHYYMRSPVQSSEPIDAPEPPSTSSMFYITAEILDGCNSGTFSQLEVASASETEKSEIDNTSSSRFCMRGANPQGQVIVKCVEPEGTNSCSTCVNSSPSSSSSHGTKSPVSSSKNSLTSSYKSPMVSSYSPVTSLNQTKSMASSVSWKNSATSSCIITPSSLSTTTVSVSSFNSLPYSRISIKNSSILNSSDSKNNLFIHRPTNSSTPDVLVNNSILNSTNNEIVNSVPKTISWNSESGPSKEGPSLTNGPSSKLQKIVYSDTENL